MSVRPDFVTREAQRFSLNDYVTNTQPAPQRQLTFDLSKSEIVKAKLAAQPPPTAQPLPHLSFALPNMRSTEYTSSAPSRGFALTNMRSAQYTSSSPSRGAESKVLPAGFVSGGGGSAETIRLTALLEEANMKYNKLAAKLASTETSLVRGNQALTTERLAAKAKSAQLVAELRVARDTEAKLRQELLCSPATAAAQAETSKFKLLAEGAVQLETEHAASVEKIAHLHTELQKSNDELVAAKMSMDAVKIEHDRTCAELGKLQAGKVTERADNQVLDETVAAIATLHDEERNKMQSEIDRVATANAVMEKQISDLTAANEETNLALARTKEEAATKSRGLEEAATESQHQLKELGQSFEKRCAEATKVANAKLAASNQRFEAMSATLPAEAQQELNRYAELLAQAKLLAAKASESTDASIVAAVAERHARQAFDKLSFGTASSQVFYTRDRSTTRPPCRKPNIVLRPIPRVGISATGTVAMSTDASDIDVTLTAAKQIAAMPKMALEDRVRRAVSSVKVDLVAALHSSQQSYNTAVGA